MLFVRVQTNHRKPKSTRIKRVIMLTGDKSEVANAVAKEVGIDEVGADCLPSDKIARLKETKEG